MVRLSACMFAAAMMIGLAGAAMAEDAKTEVKLTGTVQCAKCSLKEEGVTKCQDVLSVKTGDDTTKYYLIGNDHATTHVCHGTKDGITVTGTVEEKDGKKWLTVTKMDMPPKTEGGEHHHAE